MSNNDHEPECANVKTGIDEKTFKAWTSTTDPNSTWLRGEIVDRRAVRVWCALCLKHAERLKGGGNFSDAFVVGIRGVALKKDGVVKHSSSFQHGRAETLEKGRLPMDEFFTRTSISKFKLGWCKVLVFLSLPSHSFKFQNKGLWSQLPNKNCFGDLSLYITMYIYIIYY
jgi:hypothetical protein